MNAKKQVNYQSTNTYSTLNSFSGKTRNIWFVCHGLGYLSDYFIKYFDHLDKAENYIVAPQAPAKYYQDKSFKYVGASWFTREDLEQEKQNVLHYMNAVYNFEIEPRIHEDINLVLFGYSQGVSVITRWAAYAKITCQTLLLHSGGIPKELTPSSFEGFNAERIVSAYGLKDEYLTKERMQTEFSIYKNLWKGKMEIIPFDGKHEVNRDIISKESEIHIS
ncbi:MAG: esterase [Leeuwenhoekiella sp.]